MNTVKKCSLNRHLSLEYYNEYLTLNVLYKYLCTFKFSINASISIIATSPYLGPIVLYKYLN